MSVTRMRKDAGSNPATGLRPTPAMAPRVEVAEQGVRNKGISGVR